MQSNGCSQNSSFGSATNLSADPDRHVACSRVGLFHPVTVKCRRACSPRPSRSSAATLRTPRPPRLDVRFFKSRQKPMCHEIFAGCKTNSGLCLDQKGRFVMKRRYVLKLASAGCASF